MFHFFYTGDVVKIDPIFRFENSWFLREGLDDLVVNSWQSIGSKISSLDNWQTKLRCVRPKLKGWNRNMNAWYRELKRHILEKLDSIDKKCEVYGLNIANNKRTNGA